MLNESLAHATPPSAASTTVPKRLVFAVTEKGDKSFWTRIGVAFTNRDGSQTVRLDAVPINGILQIREEDPNWKARGGQTGGAL